MVDKMFLGMANGVDVMAEMAKGNADPAEKAAMAVLFHGYPWHAAACGDLDLTGYRKPQSYYRDILWNGGDRVYATVRLPEPEGKKIIAMGWATYPTLPTWTWPGQEGKNLQVEVYSGAEKVQIVPERQADWGEANRPRSGIQGNVLGAVRRRHFEGSGRAG